MQYYNYHGYILTILLCMLTKTTVGTHTRVCVCVCVCVYVCVWRERESGIAMVLC